MNNKLTDFELVQGFVAGDNNCIDALIRKHKNRVYTYILLVVKNSQLAEDIFQETFIKVIKSLKKGKYKDKGIFVSWVVRIAHNLIIDYFRKQKNIRTISNEYGDIDLFNSKKFSDINIEDILVREQIRSDVRSLIDLLPIDQKKVILLRHYEGYSFKRIAKETDVSINTALGRMRYALINLRKLIKRTKLNLTIY